MTNLELINKLETLEDVHKAEAHVIQCNDMVICVVLGSQEDAKARMEVEREVYYQRNKWVWNSHGLYRGDTKEAADREGYRQQCYWHANAAPLY